MGAANRASSAIRTTGLAMLATLALLTAARPHLPLLERSGLRTLRSHWFSAQASRGLIVAALWLAAALAKNHPLIVMVSLAGCPYCHAARRSYLLPMWREGVPLVQVDMRSQTGSVDFNGQRVTHDQLVQQWRISIAPTLLFFGPQGREVADRMEGAYLPDFYGSYLEARIQKARSAW